MKRDGEGVKERPREKAEMDGERQERSSVQFNLLQPTQKRPRCDRLMPLTGVRGKKEWGAAML